MIEIGDFITMANDSNISVLWFTEFKVVNILQYKEIGKTLEVEDQVGGRYLILANDVMLTKKSMRNKKLKEIFND